jgi:hypothetical protein
MATNVPAPTFGATGFIAPQESAILAGVQADQNTAFGGNLNLALNTPQGQLAQSETAIIGDANNQFLALANGVDPAYASGRMQDAIGRIYFIERNPAQGTVVVATCTGLPGVVIPLGAQAIDQNGNIYNCTQSGTIPVGNSINLEFTCTVTGAIACPTGFLNTIYQAIPGWDTITNAAPGVEGNAVESRAEFEFRREASVALNAQGSAPSVLGAVFNVTGVLDAYVLTNDTSVTSGAVVTGGISNGSGAAGTTLNVTAVSSGSLAVGQTVTGAGIAQGTIITALGTGTGGIGTYIVNVSQLILSEALTCAVGGVPLVPNSIYVAAYGGSAPAIAQAIWSKKSPGCNYNGNTTETVVDPGTTAQPYNQPYPSYQVTFQIPTPTPVLFAISMKNNSGVPSNAIALVQAAVAQSFVGADGGTRARIGSYIFASRFYANITALGAWAEIFSILLGVGTANQNSVLMQIDQEPTLGAISVAFS